MAVLVVLAVLVGCGGDDGGSDGSAPDDLPVQVVLGLRRDQSGLEDVARAVNDPSAPEAGIFLGSGEIGARFGASDDDVDAVTSVLDEAGLGGELHASGGLVTVSATVGEAEELLDVAIDERNSSSGGRYVQPAGEPTLPDDLDGTVTEVVGITRHRPRRQVRVDVDR
ncbi:MAG: protease pro-enzyme activation domain-containing protein [Acidimicrobiia bacterium]|nr:protease pro-enzyme activation domain-containing protein [Acidimicrobiia bacterium]